MQLTVNGITSTGGDSGGPSDNNYAAYGVHNGTASFGKYVTPVTRATKHFNLKVCVEGGC